MNNNTLAHRFNAARLRRRRAIQFALFAGKPYTIRTVAPSDCAQGSQDTETGETASTGAETEWSRPSSTSPPSNEA